MRFVEGHIRTNRLRVHLKSVHPLMKLSNDFRWRGTLYGHAVNCNVDPSKTIKNPKKNGLQSLPIHGPER